MRLPYYIIESPTAGVLNSLDETPSGLVGRFSIEGGRSEGSMHFASLADALRARERITPASRRAKCAIRSSEDDGTYNGAWPIVVQAAKP